MFLQLLIETTSNCWRREANMQSIEVTTRSGSPAAGLPDPPLGPDLPHIAPQAAAAPRIQKANIGFLSGQKETFKG